MRSKKMRSLVFDSGPVINFALNNILWVFPLLKEKFNGNFYVTRKVKEELIENPLKTQRFKFEALHIIRYFDNNIFQVYPEEHKQLHKKLFDLFNKIYKVNGRFLEIVHPAEIEAVAAAVSTEDSTLVVDERTIRLIIENPKLLANLLEKKLNSRITIDSNNLKTLQSMIGNLRIIRSIELVVYAFEEGLLDKYISPSINNPKKILLDALIWGFRLNGCSISMREVEEIIKLEIDSRR